jgi:enoyl-CoA hydratase/carnithine racemase
MMKRSLYRNLDWQRVREAAYDEAFAQVITIGTEDLREGVDALLSKREPCFQGK